uniref:Cwf21 domain-containing protein n=1 Tax=Macrostomum lignano TaxID=282301 RepID=A0A1I8FLQ1_9PLAT
RQRARSLPARFHLSLVAAPRASPSKAIQAALGSATSAPTQAVQNRLPRHRRGDVAQTRTDRHCRPSDRGKSAAFSTSVSPDPHMRQLMRAIQSVEVAGVSERLGLITRPNGASFWVNRCTGQFRSHAPTQSYRAQAAETKICKARIAELEEELRLARLSSASGKLTGSAWTMRVSCRNWPRRVPQLLRLEHSYEKLKAEQSKKDELVEAEDAELLRRLKQIRALEEKGLKSRRTDSGKSRDFEHTAQLNREAGERKSGRSSRRPETNQLRSEAARCVELDERLAECAEACEQSGPADELKRRLADELAAAKAECQRLRGLLEELGTPPMSLSSKTEDASVGNRRQQSYAKKEAFEHGRNEQQAVYRQHRYRERDGSFSQRRRQRRSGGRRGSSRASRQLRERLVELHIHLGD